MRHPSVPLYGRFLLYSPNVHLVMHEPLGRPFRTFVHPR